MEIHIITLFPEMFRGFFEESIIKRAIQKELVKITLYQLRNYGIPSGNKKQVDDYPYGGGAGMVLMPEPIYHCIEDIKKQNPVDEIIYLTPDGELFEQQMANELSLKKSLVMICGRYKGIDQRIRDHVVTREISIGNYVLSGGELAAAVVSDAIIRLIPGVISDESSALTDSFQAGLLDAPLYTRPAQFKGWKVPEVLLSGNHKEIEKWRDEHSLLKTKQRRPDLLND